jgi:hypothetical protein
MRRAIRAAGFDEPDWITNLAGVLRQLVMHKLEVANPRYLKAATRQG